MSESNESGKDKQEDELIQQTALHPKVDIVPVRTLDLERVKREITGITDTEHRFDNVFWTLVGAALSCMLQGLILEIEYHMASFEGLLSLSVAVICAVLAGVVKAYLGKAVKQSQDNQKAQIIEDIDDFSKNVLEK